MTDVNKVTSQSKISYQQLKQFNVIHEGPLNLKEFMLKLNIKDMFT